MLFIRAQNNSARRAWEFAIPWVPLFVTWLWALGGVPSDIHQGDVYRILYVHVSCAFVAFSMAVLLCGTGIAHITNQCASIETYGLSFAEAGMMCTLLTLATGSIWGKPTWGVWWTWDARLTTTFLLAILYLGYLTLWYGTGNPRVRNRVCAVLSVLILADIPVIYKSVTWWRTLHQPPSLFRADGAAMSPPMMGTLAASTAALAFLILSWCRLRARNLATEAKLRSEDDVFASK